MEVSHTIVFTNAIISAVSDEEMKAGMRKSPLTGSLWYGARLTQRFMSVSTVVLCRICVWPLPMIVGLDVAASGSGFADSVADGNGSSLEGANVFAAPAGTIGFNISIGSVSSVGLDRVASACLIGSVDFVAPVFFVGDRLCQFVRPLSECGLSVVVLVGSISSPGLSSSCFIVFS